VFERIDTRVRIDEVKKLGRGEGLIETVWIRLESEEQKKEVMGRKRAEWEKGKNYGRLNVEEKKNEVENGGERWRKEGRCG